MTTVQEVAASIIAEHPFPARPPWSPHDDAGVEVELRRVVADLAGALHLECRAEFDHYGSGYASFVDVWFFRPDPSFRRSAGTDHFTGLVVLLSRLAPFYCFLEGEKAWASDASSSSYLPAFEAVDALATNAVITLSAQVEEWLGHQGYIRLGKPALAGLLPAGVSVPTILTDGPYREFDALFHWED